MEQDSMGPPHSCGRTGWLRAKCRFAVNISAWCTSRVEAKTPSVACGTQRLWGPRRAHGWLQTWQEELAECSRPGFGGSAGSQPNLSITCDSPTTGIGLSVTESLYFLSFIFVALVTKPGLAPERPGTTPELHPSLVLVSAVFRGFEIPRLSC